MEQIITKGIFYIILGIFILSFRKNEEKVNEPLGIDTTKQLKGTAITAVLLGHMTIIFGVLQIPITMYLGAQAVEIFLFLSAFGLMCSVNKNGLKGFVKKRLLVIFVPYIVFTFVRIIFMCLTGQPITISAVIMELLALKLTTDPSMWYIQYIIIWYIIFFVVFSIKSLKLNQKVGILSLIGLIFCGISAYMWINKIVIMNPLAESMSHHLCFPLGAVFFLYYDKSKKLNNSTYLITSAISAVVFGISSSFIPSIVPYYIANISFIVGLVSLFMFITKKGYKSKLLSKLGDLAYYIYLNELMVMFITIVVLRLSAAIAVLTVFVVSILLAIVTRLISNLILKVLK